MRTTANIIAGKICSTFITTPTLPRDLRAYKRKHPQWCFVVFRRVQVEKGMRHFLHITKRRAWKHALRIVSRHDDWFLSDCGRSIILDDRPWQEK